eukprot:1137864-Pelagomonas_calceolata.AAC.1
MNGLHHAHGYQHKVRSAKPLDFSQLVADFRSQYLAYWRQFSAYHPRDLTVKFAATNWPVLRECGQEPLQFYWLRATVKTYASSNGGSQWEALSLIHAAERSKLNTPYINEGKGGTLVHRPHDPPTTKFRLREARQAEKEDRSSNKKESIIFLPFFSSNRSARYSGCRPPLVNPCKPLEGSGCPQSPRGE